MSNDLNATTFGASAPRYAAARPRYPAAMFDWIADLAPARHLAWDAGCGNGQATVDMASRFDSVIATDSSAEQIALAPTMTSVEWRVGPVEEVLLPASAVDAAIAANAFHWFDLARFYPTLLAALSTAGCSSPSVTAGMCCRPRSKSRFWTPTPSCNLTGRTVIAHSGADT